MAKQLHTHWCAVSVIFRDKKLIWLYYTTVSYRCVVLAGLGRELDDRMEK